MNRLFKGHASNGFILKKNVDHCFPQLRNTFFLYDQELLIFLLQMIFAGQIFVQLIDPTEL